MELSEQLSERMSPHNVFNIHILGYTLPIADSIIVMWGVMAIVIILALIFTRNLKTVPTGKQNFVETIVEFVNSFTEGNVGHHWRHFAPYFGTILIFLLFANIISIFNIIPTGEDLYRLTNIEFFKRIPEFEIAPPTKDINVTACMAIMSIVLVLISGIKFKKFSGWLKSFVEPMPVILPFKILDYFVRPLSLCLRLFGNILAGFTIMELVYVAVPLVIPAGLSIYFDLFDGALQAYVFVFLTSLYIAETIE